MGNTSSSDGKIASHNVGWSFAVLSTMASIPSSPRVRGHPLCSAASTSGPTRRLFQVLVATGCRSAGFQALRAARCRAPSTSQPPPIRASAGPKAVMPCEITDVSGIRTGRVLGSQRSPIPWRGLRVGAYPVASRMYSPIWRSDRVASGTTGAHSWKSCTWPGQTRTSAGTPAAASRRAASRASYSSTSEPDT